MRSFFYMRRCCDDLVIGPGRRRNTRLDFSARTQTGDPVNCGETVTEFGKDYLGSEQLTAPLSRKTRRNVNAACSRLIAGLI